MNAADERKTLRQTFDTIAAQYHKARPEYPDELFGALSLPRQLTEPCAVIMNSGR